MNTEASNLTNTTADFQCLQAPPWYAPDTLSDYPFFMLQLQFVIIFVITQSLHHFIFKHLGLPPLVAQLVAGIILSPSFYLGKLGGLETAHDVFFPQMSEEVWKTVAVLGFSLSLFIIGVKIDFSMIRGNGRKPILIGLLAIIGPTIVNNIAVALYGRLMELKADSLEMLDLRSASAIIAITSFPVIAILLNDLKILTSELGRLALATAIVCEVASILLLLGSKSAAAISSKDHKVKILGPLGIVALLVTAIFLIRPFMNRIVKWTPKGRPVRDEYLLVVFTIALLAAIVTDLSGEFVILGCFIAGATVPDGPPLGSSLANKLESFFVGMLLPFFVTTSAMRANVFSIASNHKQIYGHLLVTISAFMTKIILTVACGMYYNMNAYDAISLSAILSSKGILDISAYNMFSENKMIQDSTFAFLILVATIVALIVPLIIKRLYHPLRRYSGYQKRDIMHCKLDGPVRILACICRQENVSAVINLLFLSSDAAENSVVVDVLHLIKLVGRSHPLFISHDVQKIKESHSSYSDDVIWSFNKFRTNNAHNLSMHYYTALSPNKAMHDDICTLALDRLSSMIILPFHRKISNDGSLISEDHSQRMLNISVLERAPCSVGILVDRGNSKVNVRTSNMTSVVVQSHDQNNVVLVAVVFMGGKDDREAVSYAKRLAKGHNVKVIVIRLIALGEDHSLSVIDSSTVTGIQEFCSANQQFSFMEKVVREGPETARMLRSLVGDFDLFIVGRRMDMDCTQTSGLKEWSDVPELGILGDLLASPDLKCRTSVLVVQQQKQWTLKEYKGLDDSR